MRTQQAAAFGVDTEKRVSSNKIKVGASDYKARKETDMSILPRLLLTVVILVMLIGTTNPAPAYDKFGAIAYSSSTGRYGYSYNFADRGQAESEAVSNCGRSDCRIKVWFKNACGALATGNRGASGWAWNTSKSDAVSRALRECSNRGSGCQLTSWACTDR